MGALLAASLGDAERPRSIRVAASDDVIIRALVPHLPVRLGWRIAALEGPPETDALVIVDLDSAEAQSGAVAAVRGAGFSGPVLILGGDAATQSPDDEPLPRPVRLGALLSRIALHWASPASADAIRLGPYDFLPAERLLRRPDDDEAVRLTELECRLLLHLAEAEGALVDRDQLLAHVWGYSAGVDSHTVETHVWRLRQKIETDEPSTHFLVTEAGGYRLLADGQQEG